jgi:hypothetical protein
LIFGKRARAHHAIALIRDLVEIAAIVAAGVWAFYVFAYENRIKPSFAQPDVNVTASLQLLSARNGMLAIGLRTGFHNVGTVRAHFLAFAVNVYGQRILPGGGRRPSPHGTLQYEYAGFYHLGPTTPVYTYAYVTKLGDPATGQDTEIDPGTAIENYRAFYVPQGKFDLLTVGIDAPYTKYEDKVIPTKLSYGPGGDVKVVLSLTPNIQQYNIMPVSSIDIR